MFLIESGKKMKSHLFLAIIATFVVIVGSQTQEGFISLDCGLPADQSPYTERFYGLIYTSDSSFIQTGNISRVDESLNINLQETYLSLRYFPQGKRNCYTLNVTRDTNYLIIVTFVYGNYDGLNTDPTFDVYIGSNKWLRMDLKDTPYGIRQEIIYKARSNSLDLCLVKTGETVPLISSIELRPLRNNTYHVTPSSSLKMSFRVFCSNSTNSIRYSDDVHDRIWFPFFDSSYSEINTTLDINNSDIFEVPKTALQSAIIPKKANDSLVITWRTTPINAKAYVYLHFAEIQSLQANESREFDIILKGNFNRSDFSPPKLELLTVFTDEPIQCDSNGCKLELVRTPSSTLPPLINALEVYTVVEFPELETSISDVVAIKNIKVSYRVSEISWQGDPCLPHDFSWEKIRCNYINATAPRIISLNLSKSGLTGSIAPIFEDLTLLQELDLSNNSLTGPVPAFLANMKSLSLIILSWNNLTGSVPQALLDREKAGLVLKLDGNPGLCVLGPCSKKKEKKFLIPVIAAAASVFIVVVVVALFFVFRKKKLPSDESDSQPPQSVPAPGIGNASKQSDPSFVPKKTRFSYLEVQELTNNFQRALGEGGFGIVYHGCINGTQQVAVKLLSQSSAQGYKHFKAEVELLMRVHHINLVSLVGYCDEGHHLALIYEYMPNGDLKQHLSGNRSGLVLSWESRLRIAVDTALGLEYLHTGCKPPMVHRDIKTTNILLDEHFYAKLADFGLSRSFPDGNETYVSTVVAGTPGYLDPEYYQTNWLTEKSDVYSFGIVLLEIITNRRIIDSTHEKSYIVEWVGFMIMKGDIGSIVDLTLHRNYDSGSLWKALEVAMSCVNLSSARRPTMSRVVNDLKECLISEHSRVGESREMESISSMNLSMDFDVVTPRPR